MGDVRGADVGSDGVARFDGPRMIRLVAELRLAARALLRSPGFLIVATLTLALGVGSVSSIYTVIRGTLLQPLPYPAPHELVRVNRLRPPYSGPVTASGYARSS